MRTYLATLAVGLTIIAGSATLGGYMPNWLFILVLVAVVLWMIGADNDESRRRIWEAEEQQRRREADLRRTGRR